MGASDFDELLAMSKRMLAEHDRLIQAFKAEGRDLTEVLELREQLVALVKNVALLLIVSSASRGHRLFR